MQKKKTNKGLGLENTMARPVGSTNLISHTYEWKYKNAVYHITLESDSTVHWELVEGECNGSVEEINNYISSQIAYHQLLFPGSKKVD